jgi:hypothetical protein
MLRFLPFLFLAFILSGCQADIAIEDLKDVVDDIVSSHDFLNSTATVSAPAPADGTSLVTGTVHLQDSDGSNVQGYTPTYTVTSGMGVITANCTMSSIAGISFCQIRATQKGTKTISFNNLSGFSLSANPVFTFSAGKNSILGQVSGAQKTTTLGYKITHSLGHAFSGVRQDASSGYKVYSNIHGQVESQNEP